MIVLDTNVISELIRLHPEPHVLDWVNSIDTPAVVTTATTAAELLFGAERLPNGHRRTMLVASIRMMLEEDLRGQVLPFDQTAAEAYARIRAGRKASGRPINNADAQIAAICQVSHAAIATRNVKDFEGVGIKIVNPWGDLDTAQTEGAQVVRENIDQAAAPDKRCPGRAGDVVTGWTR